MKIVLFTTLCLGAVSAFGLQTSNSNNALKSLRTNAPFGGRNQAMVQPISIDGQRMNNNANIVSIFI